jgi:hypothetical protein
VQGAKRDQDDYADVAEGVSDVGGSLYEVDKIRALPRPLYHGRFCNRCLLPLHHTILWQI